MGEVIRPSSSGNFEEKENICKAPDEADVLAVFHKGSCYCYSFPRACLILTVHDLEISSEDLGSMATLGLPFITEQKGSPCHLGLGAWLPPLGNASACGFIFPAARAALFNSSHPASFPD